MTKKEIESETELQEIPELCKTSNNKEKTSIFFFFTRPEFQYATTALS